VQPGAAVHVAGDNDRGEEAASSSKQRLLVMMMMLMLRLFWPF
jgi:hypothetical protein